jgi:predicted component of type VI protein secretion system
MFGLLTVLSGPDQGRKFTVLGGETLVLGSGPAAGAQLADPSVAPVHCQVRFDANGMLLSDAGGGTRVNGAAVHSHKLQPGEVLQVGNIRLRFEWSYEDEKSTGTFPALKLPLKDTGLGGPG